VSEGVHEIARGVPGQIADARDPRHSNVRALVETDARRILWRDDLFHGQLAVPFRRRDLDAPRPGGLSVGPKLSPERAVR
jgi:hypothetical protein